MFDFGRILTGVCVVVVGHSGPYTPDSQPMGGYMLDGQAHMAARAPGDILYVLFMHLKECYLKV